MSTLRLTRRGEIVKTVATGLLCCLIAGVLLALVPVAVWVLS